MTYKSKRHQYNSKNKHKNTLKLYRGGEASILSNIELLVSIILQGLQNASEKTIKTFAKYIDPTINTEMPVNQTLSQLKDRLNKILIVLKSPVGQEILNSATQISNKFVEAGTEPIKKVFDEGMLYAQKQIPVLQDMAKTTLFGMPVIGSAAAALEDGLDVAQAVENTVETTAKMVNHGEEFIDKVKAPIDDAKNLWNKLESNLDNVNQSISTNLNQKMNELQQPIQNIKNVPTVNTINNSINNGINNSINNSINKNLNNIIETKKMIGGRIHKSRQEFFNSSNCKTRKNYNI